MLHCFVSLFREKNSWKTANIIVIYLLLSISIFQIYIKFRRWDADHNSRERPKYAKTANIIRAKINALKLSFNRYFSCHGISWEKYLSKGSLIEHYSLTCKHLIYFQVWNLKHFFCRNYFKPSF